MLTIAIDFPAGRFHATPWGKHVNEADVEWPPSPWRLIRALLAVWYRKADKDRFSQDTLQRLVGTLASELPGYQLPSARQSHSRHYMPTAGGKKTLVFDGFAIIPDKQALIINWPGLELSPEETALLDHLLEKLGYLGRAESWINAQRLPDWQGELNTLPAELPADPQIAREAVQLLAPWPADQWKSVRQTLISDNQIDSVKGKTGKRLQATLPEALSDALCVDTGQLQKEGWSLPPAARPVSYYRPWQALNQRQASHTIHTLPTVTQVRMQLSGKPLPRIEDSLRVSEAFRAALIHMLDKRLNLPVPNLVSGHNLPDDNRHSHAFYLAEDADRDGHIDHLLLHIPGGITADVQQALNRLNKLWLGKKGEWQLVFENSGDNISPLTVSASVWQSQTPYLHPWHAKKGFGVYQQLLRECRSRGLPEPQIEQLDTVQPGKTPRRPVHFHRFRKRRGLNQPDRQGSFWRLRFPEPVSGPLALGFACHFGMGLFKPEE
ncbi:type I-U CRISPR-associated protein Csb2 [Granulosicoccaceae sp. 1_MG-2023]|nr:type I-U CRISPR-associated protein Csb2 [Granulosicoccaceae sp. 1_MG-2023]